MRRREENSVRVTNLSEDTREDDLRVRTRLLLQLGEGFVAVPPRQGQAAGVAGKWLGSLRSLRVHGQRERCGFTRLHPHVRC